MCRKLTYKSDGMNDSCGNEVPVRRVIDKSTARERNKTLRETLEL